MPITTNVWTQPEHVDDLLRRHGLSVETMQHVALAWGTEMRSGTEDLPRSHPAYNAWSRGTESVRIRTKSAGYTSEYYRGVELCVHKERGTAIVLCSGNLATGDPHRDPSTRHPRGTCSREVLLAQTAFPWFGDRRRSGGPRYETWIILARLQGALVYTEFSWPATVSKRGHVGKWRERIILPPLDLDAPIDSGSDRPGDKADLPDDIDVPVTPRT